MDVAKLLRDVGLDMLPVTNHEAGFEVELLFSAEGGWSIRLPKRLTERLAAQVSYERSGSGA